MKRVLVLDMLSKKRIKAELEPTVGADRRKIIKDRKRSAIRFSFSFSVFSAEENDFCIGNDRTKND